MVMSDPREGNEAPSELTLFDYTNTVAGAAGNVNNFVLKPMSTSEAFRKYSWLRGAPVLNKSGNLRGMVINSRMRTVYSVSDKAGNYLAVVAALMEIGKEMSRLEMIYKSDADRIEKASRMLMIGSAAILRSVTSIVPTAFHFAMMSAQGYAQIFSLATGSRAGVRLGDQLVRLDREVKAIHQKQWDGENWYHFLEAVL